MLGRADSNSDQPIATMFVYDTRDLCCSGMHKNCSDDQKMNCDKNKFSSRWKCEWKASDEMQDTKASKSEESRPVMERLKCKPSNQ